MIRFLKIFFLVIICFGLFSMTENSEAANYPLEIINIKPVGVDGMSPNNRIFKAYPGLEYNIRAAVIGGAFPYQYHLVSGPSGMTVNIDTGEIIWPDPQANASATIKVIDQEAAEVTASWTISVTTAGFKFIDAVNGRTVANGGTGSISNPWRSMLDIYEGNDYDSKRRSSYANQFVYFKNGTYNVEGYIENQTATYPGRIAYMSGTKPVVWLAYPGHTPILDFQTNPLIANSGPFIIIYGTSSDVYIDGITLQNMHYKGFEVDASGHYQTFRRLTFRQLGPTPGGGYNQAFIMTTTNAVPSNYMVIQNNIMTNVDVGCAIKIYAKNKLLIEDNVISNIRDTVTITNIEGIALKDDIRRFTVRRNTLFNIATRAIGGNMHETTTSGEILFNRIYNASTNAVEINQDGMAGPIHIYRNTFVGRVQVRNTDSTDGPFYFQDNVIINETGGNKLTYYGLVDESRLVLSGNITGVVADNITDANGNLQGVYWTNYLGIKGHEIVAADTTPPSAPSNLAVQ